MGGLNKMSDERIVTCEDCGHAWLVPCINNPNLLKTQKECFSCALNDLHTMTHALTSSMKMIVNRLDNLEVMATGFK